MKKTLVAAILGIAAVASTFAQGRVNLNTYNAGPSYPQISYGADNANGSSGGTPGTFIPFAANFKVGLYWAAGNVSTGTDSTGYALISSFAPSLALGTGTGSTVTIGAPPAGAGWFASGSDFTMPGVASGSATLIIVAYNGATYDSSTIRGHSSAFNLTPAQNTDAGTQMGNMLPFAVFNAVPEPSTFALAGLGLASLLIFRRRK